MRITITLNDEQTRRYLVAKDVPILGQSPDAIVARTMFLAGMSQHLEDIGAPQGVRPLALPPAKPGLKAAASKRPAKKRGRR